jgi:hypothetical protein
MTEQGGSQQQQPSEPEEPPQPGKRLNVNLSPQSVEDLKWLQERLDGGITQTEAIRRALAFTRHIRKLQDEGVQVCVCPDGDYTKRRVLEFVR